MEPPDSFRRCLICVGSGSPRPAASMSTRLSRPRTTGAASILPYRLRHGQRHPILASQTMKPRKRWIRKHKTVTMNAHTFVQQSSDASWHSLQEAKAVGVLSSPIEEEPVFFTSVTSLIDPTESSSTAETCVCACEGISTADTRCRSLFTSPSRKPTPAGPNTKRVSLTTASRANKSAVASIFVGLLPRSQPRDLDTSAKEIGQDSLKNTLCSLAASSRPVWDPASTPTSLARRCSRATPRATSPSTTSRTAHSSATTSASQAGASRPRPRAGRTEVANAIHDKLLKLKGRHDF